MLPPAVSTGMATVSSARVAAVGRPIPICSPHSISGATVRPLIVVSLIEAKRTNCCKAIKPAYLYKMTNTAANALARTRLKARGNNAHSDPILMLAGGPGGAASESYIYSDRQFEKASRQRDIYLIDQRGTGRSTRLQCEAHGEQLTLATLNLATVKAEINRCLAGFTLPPSLFTTSIAIRDFEFIRQALGVKQWNILGTSYGTRVAQHYVRIFPSAIRTAVLDAVVYPELNLGPDIALQSQRALDVVLNRCENDSQCIHAFPGLREGVQTLIKSLKGKGRRVEFENISSGRLESHIFTRDHLAIVLRMSLYQDEQSALLPLLLHEASANHNVAPMLRQALLVEKVMNASIDPYMHNSVICAEDVPFYQPNPDLKKKLDATFIGGDLLEYIHISCENWPVGYVDKAFKHPLVSDIPILLLSGTEDPITPPAYADRASKKLTNALHVIVNGQGHGVAALGCAPTLVAKFIDEASVKQLDTACLDRMRPAPFFLTFNGPAP